MLFVLLLLLPLLLPLLDILLLGIDALVAVMVVVGIFAACDTMEDDDNGDDDDDNAPVETIIGVEGEEGMSREDCLGPLFFGAA